MGRQRLMLFSLSLIMVLFSVAACGETPSDEIEPVPDSASTELEAGPTKAVASAGVDQSTEVEEAKSGTDASVEVGEADTAAALEVPAEAEAEADETETTAGEEKGVQEPGNGEIIADTGFRPEVDGFSFPNYGAEANLEEDLTGLLVWEAFGDVVCANIEDDTCTPTPAAELWVNVLDRAEAGGHCEGFAALSAELFNGNISLEELGVSTASELERLDALEDISFEWMTQAIEPVASATAEFRQMTPTEILDILITSMNDGSDFFTMGLYGPNGGHSVTPYAVEDLGNGILLVYVYDSNYPGAEKFVEFDTTDDTWRYAGGALAPADDPQPWEGGQGSLDLTSTEIRFAAFECPFCGRSGQSLADKILILLNGKGGRVSATNGQNKRVAMGAGNSEVNEIPGSKVVRMKGNPLYDDDRNWLMILPADNYTINVTGATNEVVEPTQVAIFQPGRSYVVDDIDLDPGQEDQITITEAGEFSYMAGDDEVPTLELGTDEVDGIDGLYMVSGAELSEGYSFTIATDEGADNFRFFEDDPDLETFDLAGYTVDAEGSQNQFSFDDVVTGDNDQAIFELEDNADFISLGLDEDLDGQVDIPDADGDGILDTNEPDTDGDGIIDDNEGDLGADQGGATEGETSDESDGSGGVDEGGDSGSDNGGDGGSGDNGGDEDF